MKAVILAAGKGTRMQGLCDELPKPLLPVGNRPILSYTLAQVEASGIDEALLVVGHRAEQVRDTLGAACGRVALRYVVQSDPKGTGQATALAEEFAAGEPFLLMFGDIVTSARHLPDITRIYADERPAAILSVRYFRDPASGGAVYVDGSRVERIVERPSPGDTTTHYINAGIFVFPPAIFDLLRQVGLSPRGEYELTDAIRLLIEGGGIVRAYDLEKFWINVTDPANYLEAQHEFFAETPPPAAALAAGVQAQGAVVVAADSTLHECALGPNVSIGSGCSIGPGSIVREAVVMDGAQVGAGARVEGAVVGLGAQVSPGAVLVGEPGGRAAVVGHGEAV